MQIATIANVSLQDLMLRLDAREKQVVALASSSSSGWGNVVCWAPDDLFSVEAGEAATITEQLDAFVKAQHALDRLVVGYVSYDLGVSLHGVEARATNDLNTPLAFVAGFSNWVSFESEELSIHSRDHTYIDSVKQIVERAPRAISAKLYEKDFAPSESREQYHAKYQKVKDYITAGDVYQTNLTHRLEAETSLEGRDLFCALSKSNNSAFRAYVEGDGFEILSFSPERFIKVSNGVVETSPIKGTRPRGATAIEDEKLRDDLRDNPKDKAELNMITDLLRNDVGALSKIGTVSVEQQRTITAYPTLWHAHSTVTGQLIDGVAPMQALTSMMPGGSITGCPKRRAIEIIDELEQNSRGVYTGSIFTSKSDGSLDSNIAIRTIIKKGSRLYLSVGGGIVNDSVEEDEYQESIDKAASFKQLEPRLSSDILEEQFGATRIEILHQNETTRVIQTITEKSNQVLEISMVEFVQTGVSMFPEIHQEILQGKSMGKAFRERGLNFTRNLQSANMARLESEFAERFASDAQATVIEVAITVGPNNTHYATILETYSPEVAWPMSDREAPLPMNKLEQLRKLLAYNKEQL